MNDSRTSISKVRVSVVVPVRNEEAHIRTCLESLLDQSIPTEDYEVIAVDGNSTDKTLSVIREIQETRKNLRVLENRAEVMPVGMNMGIRSARGSIIVVAGAHATYPQHFLGKSLEFLEKTGAEVVGGCINSVPSGKGLWRGLISVILSSWFGVGNSRFRTSTSAGFVDTVPFGAYRREILERVGLFNERLSRNQDNELSQRIRTAGGKIYLTPELTVQYHPSGSFLKLLAKAFRDSQWHFFTVYQNARSMSARHFVPLILLGVLSISIVSSLFTPAGRLTLEMILGAYLILGLGFALRRARELTAAGILLFPFACCVFHLTYGAGTLVGLVKLYNRHADANTSASRP
jgi:glycosyltransferase involved in cell wall biosynthesis